MGWVGIGGTLGRITPLRLHGLNNGFLREYLTAELCHMAMIRESRIGER